MPQSWSEREVEVAVEAYFEMLEKELRGGAVNKTEVRRKTLPRLDDRSNGSLEFKNCNISAALLQMGYPSIDGYKPRWNFQRDLIPAIERVVKERPYLLGLFEEVVRAEDLPEAMLDFQTVLDVETPEPPKKYEAVQDARAERTLQTPNYLEIEARNRALGLRGEEFVLSFERQRLAHAGRDNLVDRVEHVSVEKGDGAGFDIRSFNLDGSDRFIEVKTTRFRKEAPFFVTANELEFSYSHADAYVLYRVYQFVKSPRLFHLPGRLSDHCRLNPTEFRASFC